MTSVLTLPAFAKINLSLRILGRRTDGYHDLDTVFQTVSLHETLKVSANDQPAIEFSCDDPRLPVNEDNLVVRAAEALRSHFAVQKGARIRLEKRIPMQAGLGGGSSDAAMTLLALNRLWGLNAELDRLAGIGAAIGADVPFFFFGGTARGTGIGDQVTVMPDAPQTFFAIVKPNADVNTGAAYRGFDERSLTTPNSKTMLSTSPPTSIFESLENDFQRVVFDLEPEIARAKAALENVAAQAVLLAGSGSALFGTFDSEDAQRRAIQAIELETGWRVFPCKAIGRKEYQAALSPVALPDGGASDRFSC